MLNRNAELVADLFARYGKQLHHFLTSRINRGDIEDITQKTYLQLLQHPNPEEINNPQAYLFRTASNLAIDSMRRDGTRSRYSDYETDTDDLSSEQPGMDAIIDSKQRLQRFIACLDELPELCRHAFILNRLEGMTHGEIARKLDISKKTVQRHIIRALEHLQDRLDQ